MILLSALLASLTGLMVGEGPAAPAQVELSATADPAQAGEQAVAVARVLSQAPAATPVVQPWADMPRRAESPARNGRTHLDMKQSWLI